MQRAQTSGIEDIVRGVRQQLNPPGAPFGLYVIPDWISEEEEAEIVAFLCSQPWSDHMSKARPTQHYGYRYTISGYSASTEKVPKDWGVLRRYADRIEHEYPGIKIAQCLANLYFRKTAIGAHRDKETPIVFGLSLAGDINMVWTNLKNSSLKYEAFIPRRSIYMMCDDAAYEWMHEVPSRTTVRYPDSQGNLSIVQTKPEWYTRVSITYRHFTQPLFGNDRLPPTLSSSVPQPISHPEPELPQLEACYLKGVIPLHREMEVQLANTIPWTTIKSRFGTNLSRLICGDAERIHQVAVYGKWVELFCERVLGVRVRVYSCFANLYQSGASALPAHRDDYDCWVFGLSFGETRTFDFIGPAVKPTSKTAANPNDIVSIEMESGDVLLFSPGVNKTYRHRILAQPSRKGRRVNLTFFIDPIPGEDPRKFLNPLPIRQETIPTYQMAEEQYRSAPWISSTPLATNGEHMIVISSTPPVQIPGLQMNSLEIYEEENGQLSTTINGVSLTFDTIEELVFNAFGHRI